MIKLRYVIREISNKWLTQSLLNQLASTRLSGTKQDSTLTLLGTCIIVGCFILYYSLPLFIFFFFFFFLTQVGLVGLQILPFQCQSPYIDFFILSVISSIYSYLGLSHMPHFSQSQRSDAKDIKSVFYRNVFLLTSPSQSLSVDLPLYPPIEEIFPIKYKRVVLHFYPLVCPNKRPSAIVKRGDILIPGDTWFQFIHKRI